RRALAIWARPGRPTLTFQAFRRGLSELGWVEGETVRIEYRGSDGHDERDAGLVDEMVRIRVDVIVTSTTPGAFVARERAGSVPIVLAIGGGPVALGLVPSLGHPGGNITGSTGSQPACKPQ